MLGVRFGAACTIVLGGMLISSAADAAPSPRKQGEGTSKFDPSAGSKLDS